MVHGNTGRAPINKIPESLKKEVQALIQTKYYDFNLQHLSELLSKNERLSIFSAKPAIYFLLSVEK